MKIYPIGLLMNARDLGGYLTRKKHVTKYQSLIRSDAPHYLTLENLDEFYKLGVKTTIDVRTEVTALKYRSPFKDDPRFNYYNFPVSEGDPSRWHIYEEWPQNYLDMVNNPTSFYGIFKTIAEAEGVVYYHCSAGKDRTGIITFLLLSLVGVSRKQIIDDYKVSGQLIDQNIHKVRALHPSFPESLGASPAFFMAEFIRLFMKKYQSVEKYLLGIGLTKDDIKKIKNKLI